MCLHNECPGYVTKPSDDEASVLELWGIWSIPLLPLHTGSLWPEVVVLVWVSSVGQIKLFNNLLHLKPFNCMQTVDVKLNC